MKRFTMVCVLSLVFAVAMGLAGHFKTFPFAAWTDFKQVNTDDMKAADAFWRRRELTWLGRASEMQVDRLEVWRRVKPELFAYWVRDHDGEILRGAGSPRFFSLERARRDALIRMGVHR